jgi:phage shock protein PspC (stress-responsive transcriptional regulator)
MCLFHILSLFFIFCFNSFLFAVLCYLISLVWFFLPSAITQNEENNFRKL